MASIIKICICRIPNVTTWSVFQNQFTYGELIDFLDYVEAKCMDSVSVAEVLCSKVKEVP